MMKIGNRLFDTENQTYIMGILNITPDSFYDGGKFTISDDALIHVEKMINEGADIIDVGGQSTRPGHVEVSVEEEINRIVPVIELIKKNFDIPISLDTYNSKVAREGICAGADMINDIWGLKYDCDMSSVIAESKVCCCLMHNRTSNAYEDLVADVLTDLKESIEIAKKAGIKDDKIIIDPGIGFAKDTEQNLKITKNIGSLKFLDYPILYAASNKSFIGNTLNVNIDDRLEGTLTTTAWAVSHGCSFIRVHQVKENKRVIQMIKAIMGGV